MSHGPPPTDIYSFGLGMASLNSLPEVNASQQMTADQQETADVMSLINTAMFDDFSAGPMNLDTLDNSALPQGFLPPTTATPRVASGITATGLDLDANAPGHRVRTNSSSGRDTSTLTDFTKRRNWAAKLVEDIRDLLVVLDRNAKLMFVSSSVQSLLGYTSDEVIDKFIKEFIHSDDAVLFDAEMNAAAATGQSFRVFCRLKKSDGTYGIFETVGHAHIANEMFDNSPNIMNKTPFCQAVFMILRPYPTKNAALLDSMLEHKIENERLMRKIAELTREEAVDKEEAIRQSLQSQEGRSDAAPSEDSRIAPTSAAAIPGLQGPINSQPASSSALTRENLEGIAGTRPDSLRDKMARYEGTSHTDTIEMLTGLRYVEGERSRGITTGDRSPTLITGDAGIAIPADRDPRTGEKMKKKQKIVEEYVCTDCGTLDSPEWRKGPHGPKTLCNACGLRWAKKEKKRNSLTGPPGPTDETNTSKHIGNNENKA